MSTFRKAAGWLILALLVVQSAMAGWAEENTRPHHHHGLIVTRGSGSQHLSTKTHRHPVSTTAVFSTFIAPESAVHAVACSERSRIPVSTRRAPGGRAPPSGFSFHQHV